MNNAAAYLNHVRALIALSRRVTSWQVIREETQGNEGLYRYRLILSDASMLEMFERFSVSEGKVRIGKYSFSEVCVAGNQGQIVLPRYRRYPDVIFGDGTPLLSQPVLHPTVSPRRLRVTAQHDAVCGILLNACQVLLRPLRLVSSIVQLAKDDGEHKDLLGFTESVGDGSLSGKQGNHDVGIQKVSTSHSDQPVRTRPQSPGASTPGHPAR